MRGAWRGHPIAAVNDAASGSNRRPPRNVSSLFGKSSEIDRQIDHGGAQFQILQ
jgi:hypothetical protein